MNPERVAGLIGKSEAARFANEWGLRRSHRRSPSKFSLMEDGYPFEIRASPIQGEGAFATEHIPVGTRVIEYAGRRLTPAEADALYPTDAPGRHHTFLFAIDDDVVIDAGVNGNDARFINHSCDPNCDAVVDNGRIWIEALRDIEPGEELAYDYAYVLNERHSPAAKKRYPCHCGAANCRGTILAKKR
jgi:SET domain-containing protein